jgi:hypothetical protein
MDKLTPEEKCMIMLALGSATAEFALDSRGRFDEARSKTWLELAHKLAGHDLYVGKEDK